MLVCCFTTSFVPLFLCLFVCVFGCWLLLLFVGARCYLLLFVVVSCCVFLFVVIVVCWLVGVCCWWCLLLPLLLFVVAVVVCCLLFVLLFVARCYCFWSIFGVLTRNVAVLTNKGLVLPPSLHCSLLLILSALFVFPLTQPQANNTTTNKRR